jgi:dipeptidyl aminopeptidase/acylaminoacyl peptidase
VKIWDAKTNQAPLTIAPENLSNRIESFAVSNSSRDALVTDYHGLTAFDLATGFRLNDRPVRLLHSLVLSDNGRRIIGRGSRTLEVWDVEKFAKISNFPLEDDFVMTVAVSSDGERIARRNVPANTEIWESKNGRAVCTLLESSRAGLEMAFSRDGKSIAGLDSRKGLTVWDASTGRVLRSKGEERAGGDLRRNIQRLDVKCIRFNSADTKIALGRRDGVVEIRDAVSLSVEARLLGHSSDVLSIDFHPDGRRLATGADDRTVRVWDVPTARLLLTLSGHEAGAKQVAFSPDGKRLISNDGRLRVWESEPNWARYSQLASLAAPLKDPRPAIAERLRKGESPKFIAETLINDGSLDVLSRGVGLTMLVDAENDLKRRKDVEAVFRRLSQLPAGAPSTAAQFFDAATRRRGSTENSRTQADKTKDVDLVQWLRTGKHAAIVANLGGMDGPAISISPKELAVLAIAQQKLGDSKGAKATFLRLQDLIKKSPQGGDSEFDELLGEAKRLIESKGP